MLLSTLGRNERLVLFICSKKRAKIKLVAICMSTSTCGGVGGEGLGLGGEGNVGVGGCRGSRESYFKAETALPSAQCPGRYW